MPLISIVIVAFRSGDVLQSAVDSLAAQSDRNFELIIVDNGCPDHCTESVDLRGVPGVIISSGDNLGFAGGCNFGVEHANGQWVAMLNPDVRAHVTWIEEVQSAIQTYGPNVIFGSTQMGYPNADIIDGAGDCLSIFGFAWRGGYGSPASHLPASDMRALSPCAAASVYPIIAFQKAGGLDRDYFCYLEDLDLGIRLGALGYPTLQLRRAKVQHEGSAGSIKPSDFALNQTAINMPRLLIKNLPFGLLVVIIPISILAQIYVTLRNGATRSAWRRFWAFVRALASRKNWASRRDTTRMSIRSLWPQLSHSHRDVKRSTIILTPVLPKTD